MKIYINDSKVRTQRLPYILTIPRRYKFNAARLFKEKVEKDIRDAELVLAKSILNNFTFQFLTHSVIYAFYLFLKKRVILLKLNRKRR